jgi:hypothetical protein
MRPRFWAQYPLEALTPEEWEALCDGCGLCCLVKLEDEDSGEVAYTRVACKLLDPATGWCSQYAERRLHVPDCIQLTPALVAQLRWLPRTCAYRLVHEKKPLPDWHPLLTGHPDSTRQARQSVAGRSLSELQVPEDELEHHIVRWVKI